MTNIDKFIPGTFCWVELATSDQDAAKKFYSSLFGWHVNDMTMPEGVYSMFQLEGRNAGAAYTLRKEQVAAGAPPHWGLYMAVANTDQSAKKAGELGGKVVAPPFDVFDIGRMAVLQDPAGAHFCIWQDKRAKAESIAGVEGTLCWADLMTRDPARAEKFYSGLFGWTFEKDAKDPLGYTHIKNGEAHIGGMPPPSHMQPNIPAHWIPYFLVKSCDATIAKANSQGAKTCVPTTSLENVGRFAVLADPQGAAFSIFEAAQH
jgi:uncharacterized protein